MSARGSYTRGRAARERLMRVAAQAAASPHGQLTLTALASAAGLTDAGALHHFSSRDGLLVAAWHAASGDSSYPDTEQIALTRELLRIALDRYSPAHSDAVQALAAVRGPARHLQLGELVDAALPHTHNIIADHE